jgi:hypothetical protein
MAYSPYDPRMLHQHIPAQTFLAVLLILDINRTRTTLLSNTVSYNRLVYPFRTFINVDKTHIVTVSAIITRKLQAAGQKRCLPQTWTTRLTKAIGTLASNATQWCATTYARFSVVNRLSRRIAPILCLLRHTLRRTSRTSRKSNVANLLNARTSVLYIFQ